MEKRPLYIASCSFGKDSIATILLALEHNEPLDRAVFAEVMFDNERGISGEIPEHIEWIYSTAIPKLEAMGVKVDVVRTKDYQHFFYKRRSEKSKPEYRGKREGFVIGGRCRMCGEKSAAIKRYYKQFDSQQVVQYVGIAIDEATRLERNNARGGGIATRKVWLHREDGAMQVRGIWATLANLPNGKQRRLLVLPKCKQQALYENIYKVPSLME